MVVNQEAMVRAVVVPIHLAVVVVVLVALLEEYWVEVL